MTDPAASTSASSSAEAKVWNSCSEFIPKGATRPKLQVSLSGKGISGHAVDLIVIVDHGAGETVMPGGFKINRGSETMQALVDAQWRLPDPAGGSAPQIARPDPAVKSDAQTVTSTITLPLVPLPDKPGRHMLQLPPLPISVARASGEIMTLCTPPRRLQVEDPIANEPEPQVRANPPARPQREVWVWAQQVAVAALITVLLALLLAWLMRYWAKRPKPEPPKPKVLPWVAALQELEAIQGSDLLQREAYTEFIDRVDDCTRRYLGERYGFDGLESTSAEIRSLLKRVYPPIVNRAAIGEFLSETDLVKFAKLTPDETGCQDSLRRAFEMVNATVPTNVVNQEGSA